MQEKKCKKTQPDMGTNLKIAVLVLKAPTGITFDCLFSSSSHTQESENDTENQKKGKLMKQKKRNKEKDIKKKGNIAAVVRASECRVPTSCWLHQSWITKKGKVHLRERKKERRRERDMKSKATKY